MKPVRKRSKATTIVIVLNVVLLTVLGLVFGYINLVQQHSSGLGSAGFANTLAFLLLLPVVLAGLVVDFVALTIFLLHRRRWKSMQGGKAPGNTKSPANVSDPFRAAKILWLALAILFGVLLVGWGKYQIDQRHAKQERLRNSDTYYLAQ